MRKISSMPAAIENRPSATKNVVRTLAASVAVSTRSCFVSVARHCVPPAASSFASRASLISL
jgi:hypothetical protein